MRIVANDDDDDGGVFDRTSGARGGGLVLKDERCRAAPGSGAPAYHTRTHISTHGGRVAGVDLSVRHPRDASSSIAGIA